MPNDRIKENESIQNGLERFLEKEFSNSDTIDMTLASTTINSSSPNKKSTPKTVQRQQDNREDEIIPGKNKVNKKQKPVPMRTNRKKKKKIKEKKGLFTKKNKNQKKRKNKEKKTSGFKKFIILLAVIIIAFLIGWYFLVNKAYNKMTYVKSDSSNIVLSKKGVTNILLIGNDSRSNAEDGRSDAMILLSISKNTKKIYMTSLLRDMYVEIPSHDGNRLNAAYSYGGAELLMDTIELNLGIRVDHYVLVNFQAFAHLVDAVGGVDLELSNEEVGWVNAYLNEYNLLEGREMTTDYLDTSLSGNIHLNGAQALAYSRNRYIGTDFGRTERQRKVLSEIIKKMPAAAITNTNGIIDGLFPNLTTNLTKTQCYRLSFLAGKFLTYDIEQMTIPAENTYKDSTIRGMQVLEVDYDANRKLWENAVYIEE